MKTECLKQKEAIIRGDVAVITDIQRYSVHDGPGIRSLVFFKGCPLQCQWCHNPETHSTLPQLFMNEALCIGCGNCVKRCTNQAIAINNNHIVTRKEQCTLCGACVEECYSNARKISGAVYTVDEIYKKVIKDRKFYENTNGGVTLSGGEVLLYPKFASRLLRVLQDTGIHTAIETCGYGSWEQFLEVLQYTDLVLFDVKHCDDILHKRYTGCSNHLILDNLKKVSKLKKDLIIRVPVIPGFNDSQVNMLETGRIAKSVGAKEIHLLPFHQIGLSKWDAIGKTYHFRNIEEPTKDQILRIRDIIALFGIPVVIGGN